MTYVRTSVTITVNTEEQRMKIWSVTWLGKKVAVLWTGCFKEARDA